MTLKRTVNAARYVLAALAGFLLALAFPKFSVAGLAWIAPGLLLFSTLGTKPRLAFRVAWTGGLTYYLTTLYWLLLIPVTFLPILGWIALSGYLALYPAAWVWLSWRLAPGSRVVERFPWSESARQSLLESKWISRTLWAFCTAATWVGLEMILGRFLSGFPWDFLGVSQYRILPVIQIAEFTGVYGVSFLIIWFSASLLLAVLAMLKRPTHRIGWSRELALPLLALIAITVFGVHRMTSPVQPAKSVSLALIQPSIPQTLIWDERENEARFKQLLKLSEEALTNHVDVLVWPEASVPTMLRHDQETADAVIDLATRHKVWIVLGSDDAERRPGTTSMKDIEYFNSAFAVSPDGELKGMYRKRRLVIFGEYVPFVKWLPFLKILSPAGESGFTPGSKPIPFHLDSLGVTLSVLICFEDTFPHIAREYVSTNTDFLVNLTNNGWFGESAAQWQHAATAAFRAVENRIPLIRCANNGLTCRVNPAGAIFEEYFPNSRDIYKAGYKIVRVPMLDGTERTLPFYTRHGDIFGWSCLAIATLGVALDAGLRSRSSRRSRQKADPAVIESPGA